MNTVSVMRRAESGPSNAAERAIWALLERVPDPEIPILSVVDLGIVRSVICQGDAAPQIGISPTYSGCPATAVIRQDIERALAAGGYADAAIHEVLSPPWTSDWLTDHGRRKLREFGIAPPAEQVEKGDRSIFRKGDAAVSAACGSWRKIDLSPFCPRCGSAATERVSEFGSTPCKAHYRCTECREPFDYFKCI